jgi:hypothetical protein
MACYSNFGTFNNFVFWAIVGFWFVGQFAGHSMGDFVRHTLGNDGLVVVTNVAIGGVGSPALVRIPHVLVVLVLGGAEFCTSALGSDPLGFVGGLGMFSTMVLGHSVLGRTLHASRFTVAIATTCLGAV